MLGITNYSAFVLSVLVFLAIPGPGLLGILAVTAKAGRRAGFLATFGVVCGDQLLMLLASLGVAAMLKAHPALFAAVQYAGAAYLVYLGVALLRAKAAGDAATAQGMESRPFVRLFLITLLNPKAIVFYMAFFPLFIDPLHYQGVVTLAAMAGTVSLLTVAFCFTCVALAHLLGGALKRHRRVGPLLHKAAGIFLIGFGIKLTTN